MKSNKKVVNFGMLCAMVAEVNSSDAIAEVISMLAMNDIPMSRSVIKLGIVLDVLLPDYKNGWSAEI